MSRTRTLDTSKEGTLHATRHRPFTSEKGTISHELILLRHGQSTWNATPTFSGWCDDPELTSRGRSEAAEAGRLLRRRGFSKFDLVYTSELTRAIETCEIVLREATCPSCRGDGDGRTTEKGPSIVKAWQLNERHYGALQGHRKNDENLMKKYGKENIRKWRRDYYATPPPLTSAAAVPGDRTTRATATAHRRGRDTSERHRYLRQPLSESLRDCQERVLRYWDETILPSMMEVKPEEGFGDIVSSSPRQRGRRVLLAVHSNTLRALVSYLDRVPVSKIPQLHIPNSVPCLYYIDPDTGQPVEQQQQMASSPSRMSERLTSFSAMNDGNGGGFSTSRGHWMFSSENYERLRDKIGGHSGGFIQAIFEAWDANGDGVLSKEELCDGLSSLKGDDDIAIAAVAGKIWEEIHHHHYDTTHGSGDDIPIDLAEFHAYAAQAFEKFVPDLVD